MVLVPSRVTVFIAFTTSIHVPFNYTYSSADIMDGDYELPHNSGAIKLSEQHLLSQRGSIGRDEADLVRLGKKPVLKVSVPTCSS